jgi:hypothetical protein
MVLLSYPTSPGIVLSESFIVEVDMYTRWKVSKRRSSNTIIRIGAEELSHGSNKGMPSAEICTYSQASIVKYN